MRKAFTLVELLVVIGIIALLVGILLPVLSRARVSSQRVTCLARLHDFGSAFQMYLSDSQNKLPAVNTMPSVQPPLNTAPSIVTILTPYGENPGGAWRCPADQIMTASAGAPSGYQTYFDREGSSFMYNPFLADLYAGLQLKDTQLYQKGEQNLLVIISDYEPFHGKPNTNGAMNNLFADMHAGDLVGL